jgi:hypothetical protein
MVIKEKRKKKTKKQKGGLIGDNPQHKTSLLQRLSPALATIFSFRSPKQNSRGFIGAEITNRILLKDEREKFIKDIKKLLMSREYQQNIPVFYGNMSSYNKSNGYNEYICKMVGSFSSRKRIFIINPFAELVYRFCTLLIRNRNRSSIIIIEKVQNLLKKLLKLDSFDGFPKIIYLPYGIRFCIVKNRNGIEEVMTSQNNISRCNLVYGCSLMMSAEIREENLPSEQDIIEFYNILGFDENLWKLYNILVNKKEYNKINKNRKLLQDKYFEGVVDLLLKLHWLKEKIIHLNNTYSKQHNIIEVKLQQNEAKKKIILLLLNQILDISNSYIPQLQNLYNYVKSKLQQQHINLLELTIQLIQYINNLIKSKPEQLQRFLSFLETKPIEKETILEILKIL